jgi:hypothetical protein
MRRKAFFLWVEFSFLLYNQAQLYMVNLLSKVDDVSPFIR